MYRQWNRVYKNDEDQEHRVSGKEVGDRIGKAQASSDLTDWEKNFLQSLAKQFRKRKSLSAKQDNLLQKIEDKLAQKASGVDPQAAVVKRIGAVLAEPNLTEWEKNFLSSIKDQAKQRPLSFRQVQSFEKIECKFSDDAKKARAEWESNFDDEKKKIWKAVIGYYSRTNAASYTARYYATSVAVTEANPDYIPSPEEWEKVTQNKYAKRVIAAVFDPPKFAVGDLVCIRSNFRQTYWKAINSNQLLNPGDYVLIIDNKCSEIRSAAKGAKVYKVLPVGQVAPVEIEERFLKKAQKEGKNK